MSKAEQVVAVVSRLDHVGDAAKLTHRIYELGEKFAAEVTHSKVPYFEHVIGTQDEVQEIMRQQVSAHVSRRGLSPLDFSFRYKYEEVVNNKFTLPYGKEHATINVVEV